MVTLPWHFTISWSDQHFFFILIAHFLMFLFLVGKKTKLGAKEIQTPSQKSKATAERGHGRRSRLHTLISIDASALSRVCVCLCVVSGECFHFDRPPSLILSLSSQSFDATSMSKANNVCRRISAYGGTDSVNN